MADFGKFGKIPRRGIRAKLKDKLFKVICIIIGFFIEFSLILLGFRLIGYTPKKNLYNDGMVLSLALLFAVFVTVILVKVLNSSKKGE